MHNAQSSQTCRHLSGWLIRAVLTTAVVLWFAGGAQLATRASGSPGSRRLWLPVRYLRLPRPVPSGGMAEPSINGGTIAVAAQYPGDTHARYKVYIGGLRHWAPGALTETGPPEPMVGLVALSASWLVWVQYNGLNWSIQARDVKNGREYRVSSSAQVGPMAADLYFPIISLSGNRVAWSYVICSGSCTVASPRLKSAVMVKTLPFGPSRTVSQASGRCLADWPSISGNTVVYQKEGRCWGKHGNKVGSDVYLDNLANGAGRRLTTNHGSSEPVTNGTDVAWKQGPPGATRWADGRIVLLALKSGRRQAISVKPPGRMSPRCWPKDTPVEQCADQPVIDNRIIEWTIDNGETILARNLVSGREYAFKVARGHVVTRPLSASGRYVVWSDTTTGSSGSTGSDIAVGSVP